MDKQTLRVIFLSIIVFIGFSLFTKYSQQRTEQSIKQETLSEIPTSVPEASNNSSNNLAEAEIPNAQIVYKNKLPAGRSDQTADDDTIVTVSTEVFAVKINPYGDLVYAELKKYPQNKQPNSLGFSLLSREDNRFYVAQSGLLSESGPDSKVAGRGKFVSAAPEYHMNPQEQTLTVDLNYVNHIAENNRIKFTKRFIFSKDSYLIEVQYIIDNQTDQPYLGSMYGRLKRNVVKQKSGFLSGGGLRTYTGAAINTPEEKYKKISFADMKNPYKISFNGGWVAMLEHYFVSAWVPDPINFSEYQTEKFSENLYGIRFVNSPIKVLPGETAKVSAKLFVGPKIVEELKQVTPALDLTVDYGVLWWLCVPLFMLLKAIFSVVGNWGWSIIITTFVVKVLFYKLSATSYKSMGNLRKLQPRIEALKANCGENKQRFSKEMMELYRKEKINPLGGCLPILVQIPVFIALYYVLLESVELRQAPWMLWINDLSSKDPFYVLPIIMGMTMFVQQRMNPPPADPVQAKVVMFMPVLFTALFLQFPAGLMLYWTINNALSILQQMFITKGLDADKIINFVKKN